MRAALFVILLSSIAAAQPASDADASFKRGRELLAAGKIAEACDAFAKSDASDPAPATKLALGVCREKNHQLATAWQLYSEVVRELLAKSDPGSAQLAKVAATNASRLEPRLSRLTIDVPSEQRIPGLEILIDEDAVDVAHWSQAQPVDGGAHVITARASGRVPWSTNITVKPDGDTQTVHVPTLAQTPGVEPREPSVAVTPPPPVTTVPRSRAAPIALGIGAVILGGGAVVLSIVASHTYDDSKLEVDVDTQLSLWHRANGERYTAEALGVVAIGGAATAVWLYVRTRGETAPAKTALVPTATGFALAGSF